MRTHHYNTTRTFHHTRILYVLYSHGLFTQYTVHLESLTRGMVAQVAEYISNVGSLIGVTPPPHNPAQPAQSAQPISFDQQSKRVVLTRKERNHEPERIPGCQEALDVDHKPTRKQEKANVQEEQVDEKNPRGSHRRNGE